MAGHSTARLFADDCIIYCPISNNDDTIIRQDDLNRIAESKFMWQMQFNIDKCFSLRIGHPKHKLVHLYTLHNKKLSETDSANLNPQLREHLVHNLVSHLNGFSPV